MYRSGAPSSHSLRTTNVATPHQSSQRQGPSKDTRASSPSSSASPSKGNDATTLLKRETEPSHPEERHALKYRKMAPHRTTPSTLPTKQLLVASLPKTPYTRPSALSTLQRRSQAATELTYLQACLTSVTKQGKDLQLQCKNAQLYLNYLEKGIFDQTQTKADYWESLAYQLLDQLVDELTPFQIDVLNETLMTLDKPNWTVRDIVAQQLGFPPAEKQPETSQSDA